MRRAADAADRGRPPLGRRIDGGAPGAGRQDLPGARVARHLHQPSRVRRHLGSRLPAADHPPRPARRRRAGGNRPGGGARQGAARSRPPADSGPLRRSAAVRGGAHPVHVRVRDAAGVVGVLGDRGRPVGGPHPDGRPRAAHGARRPARCGTLDGPDRSHDRPRVQRGAVARGQRARRRDAGRRAAATHRSGSDLANCRCRGHVRLQTLAVARRRLRAAVAAPQAGLPQPDRRGAPRPVGPPGPGPQRPHRATPDERGRARRRRRLLGGGGPRRVAAHGEPGGGGALPAGDRVPARATGNAGPGRARAGVCSACSRLRSSPWLAGPPTRPSRPAAARTTWPSS